MRPGKSLAESPGYYRRRPIRSACLRRRSWDFCKKIVFREPRLLFKALRVRTGELLSFRKPRPRKPNCEKLRAVYVSVILIHKPAHANIHHNTQRQEGKQDRRSSVTH